MHQLVQFKKFGDGQTKQVFLDLNIDDLDMLYSEPEAVLKTLPMEKRINMYYTVAKRRPNDRKVSGFIRQDHMAFDIDGIDVTREEETAKVAAKALGLNWETTAVEASGHGIHLIIRLGKPIEDPLFFEQNKKYYDACCMRVDEALKKAELPGRTDTSIFDQARVLRIPNSWNIKPGKEKRQARMLKNGIKPVDFDLKVAAGIPEVRPSESIGLSYPDPDKKAILDGCDFIKWAMKNQNDVSEPQWYALASIIGRLKGGKELFHKFSEEYKGYNRIETERKLEQALANSGPRTCANIDQLWGKCSTCKFFEKCKSPILIQGPDYIKTKETGFRHVKRDPTTGAITGMSGVDIEDLVKYFGMEHPYKIDPESETIYEFTKTHYEEFLRANTKAFAEFHVTNCKNKDVGEFFAKVLRKNVPHKSFFREGTDGYMNFQNGVLNVKTLEFKPSTSEIGFRSVLPYEYDPNAKAPVFEKFLDEIASGSEGKKKTLLEFGGYALSNDRYWDHKALLLIGHGRNGKSTFVDALRSLAEGGYSNISVSQFGNDQQVANLDGKLFNISEENDAGGFRETANFKLLASGGHVSAKIVYKPTFSFANKAKIIVLLNDPPKITDTSYGFIRRCAFVEFRARFDGANDDKKLKEKLQLERPGILNLMLAAYKDMVARGGCYESKESADYLQSFAKESNPVALWADDNLIRTNEETHFASNADLYANYSTYCEKCGYKPTTVVQLCKEMKKLWDDLEAAKIRGVRGYKGIRIRTDALNPNVDNANMDI